MPLRIEKKRLWLCLAPVALCTLDQLLTLAGQAPEYWAEGYRLPNEASPQGYWTLQQHPLLFELGILLWMALFCAAILLLPRKLSRIVSLAVVIGHAWGACTWLDNYLGYWGCIALAVVAAAATVLTWEKARDPAGGGTPRGL